MQTLFFSEQGQEKAKKILSEKFPQLGAERREELVRHMMFMLVNRGIMGDASLIEKALQLVDPHWRYPAADEAVEERRAA